MAKRNKVKYNYHQDMVDTFTKIVYREGGNHEWCAHNESNGLKKEFTQSGYGWAISCMALVEKHKALV